MVPNKLSRIFLILSLLQCCFCQTNLFNKKLDVNSVFLNNLEDNEVPKIKIDPTVVDDFIKQVMDCHGILGTALAIVQLNENDSLVDHYAQGYGVMDITELRKREVNSTSKLCIGSTTKQFTAASLGKALMERG